MNSDDRQDIIVCESESESTVELDISVAHPWARMWNRMLLENEVEQAAGGGSCNFVPVVQEQF